MTALQTLNATVAQIEDAALTDAGVAEIFMLGIRMGRQSRTGSQGEVASFPTGGGIGCAA